MKKTAFLVLILLAFYSYGQELSYKYEFDKSYKGSDYKEYISKDNMVFKIDDQIKIKSSTPN